MCFDHSVNIGDYGIKCPIYPTKEQESRLQSTLDICRDIYNHCVFESRVAYKEGDDKLQHCEMSRMVSCLTAGKEIYSKVLQPVVDKFFRNLSVMSALRKKSKVSKVGRLHASSQKSNTTRLHTTSAGSIY